MTTVPGAAPTRASAARRIGIVDRWVAELPPSAFAMVMATAVIAITAHELGMPLLARALGVLAIVAYVILWLLFAGRLVRHPAKVYGDLVDHVKGPGYLTIIAATCILGNEVYVLWSAKGPATALCAGGALLWLIGIYLLFTALTVKQDKPTLADGMTGAWLIAVVATQALAVLVATLAPSTPQPFRLEANFVAVSLWLFGGMLYIWMISLIFYRYTFFRLAPEDLTPPYWINMGAMAISTLGGSVLILDADAVRSPLLDAILPFLKGFTVFFWATGTWWIPMLVILAVWRHLVQRFPLRYDPLYWGAVFPLGMYALCTLRMAQALELKFLAALPEVFIVLAFVAWLATFVGLARAIVRGMFDAAAR